MVREDCGDDEEYMMTAERKKVRWAKPLITSINGRQQPTTSKTNDTVMEDISDDSEEDEGIIVNEPPMQRYSYDTYC